MAPAAVSARGVEIAPVKLRPARVGRLLARHSSNAAPGADSRTRAAAANSAVAALAAYGFVFVAVVLAAPAAVAAGAAAAFSAEHLKRTSSDDDKRGARRNLDSCACAGCSGGSAALQRQLLAGRDVQNRRSVIVNLVGAKTAARRHGVFIVGQDVYSPVFESLSATGKILGFRETRLGRNRQKGKTSNGEGPCPRFARKNLSKLFQGNYR